MSARHKLALVVQSTGDVGLTPAQKMTFDMHDAVAEVLEPLLGGKKLPARMLERVVRTVLVHALKQTLHLGVFKFPGQLGYLRLQRRRPSFRRGDAGEVVKNPPTVGLHFIEGNVVLSALGRRPRAIPSSATIMNYTHAFPAEQATALAAVTAQDLTMLARDVASLLLDEGVTE